MSILHIFDGEGGLPVLNKINACIDIINSLESDYIPRQGTNGTDKIGGFFDLDDLMPTRFSTDDGTYKNGLLWYGGAFTSLQSERTSDSSYAGFFAYYGEHAVMEANNYSSGIGSRIEVLYDQINVFSTEPFFKGIQGDADYSSFADALSFIQRGYVDNNFLPYTGATTSLDLRPYGLVSEYIEALNVNTSQILRNGDLFIDVDNTAIYDTGPTKIFDVNMKQLYDDYSTVRIEWNTPEVNLTPAIAVQGSNSGGLESYFNNQNANGYYSLAVYNEDKSYYGSIAAFNSAGGVGTLYDNNTVWFSAHAPVTGIINDHTSGVIILATTTYGSSGEALRVHSNKNIGISGSQAAKVTSPTALLHIAGGNATSASLRLGSSSAPTTPNNGDIWFDGTNIKMRIAGVTKTFTLT